MANKIYAGTIGLEIRIDMVDIITGATNLKFYVRKGDKTEVTWIPSIFGTTKLIYDTVIETDLIAGLMIITPYLELGSWKGLCDSVQVIVEEKFA